MAQEFFSSLLVINCFNGYGILLEMNGSKLIQGNLIGTDVTGTAALGNGGVGVDIIDAPDNVIGGTGHGEQNIISSHGMDGVSIRGVEATGNLVAGNFIGTDVTGTFALAG